jgi:hypothetical protein
MSRVRDIRIEGRIDHSKLDIECVAGSLGVERLVYQVVVLFG